MKGNLFIITGPSGVGKSTLLESLRGYDGHVYRAITSTTRPPRPGEQHRRDYYFVDTFAFQTAIELGQLVEYTEVHGNMYGLTRHEIDFARDEGYDVLVILDPIGTQIVKEAYPEAVTIFVAPAFREELDWRLENRSTDSEEAKKQRMYDAAKWMSYIGNYDFLVVNPTYHFASAVRSLFQIIEAYRHGFRLGQNQTTIWELAGRVAHALIKGV